MAVEIAMPQLSDTMDKGTILSWLKKEGDSVGRGDALAEVATDKADLEIESFHEGILLQILAPEGTTVNVGEIIALVGEPGESVPVASESTHDQAKQKEPEPQEAEPRKPEQKDASEPPKQEEPKQETAPESKAAPSEPSEAKQEPVPADRIKISPLAKNLADSHGVSYQDLEGSGEGGRIVRRDIEKALGKPLEAEGPAKPARQQVEAAPKAEPRTAPQAGAQPLSRMRETIARRMIESTTSVPHFYVTAKYRVDSLLKMRETLKVLPQYEGITINHLIIKAAALALRSVPRVNAHYEDGSVVFPSDINVGVITALEDGLLIPVVKQADTLHLADIVSEARAMVQRARSGRPKGDDLSGGTFSISNIGRYAVEDFTAVINPGQGAILAVGSVQEEPVVCEGKVAVGQVLRVTLSMDHRILDGVIGGEFLTELKRLVEEPVLLLA